MATAGALASNANLFNALAGIPKTLFGSSSTVTTSGGTSTKQTMLSQDAVNALLKDLMEDDSRGLARVASGSKQPGLYNTTSQQLLINDLLARSVAEVEKARAPEVTTKTPTTVKTEEPGLLDNLGGLGNLALGGAALYGGNKILQSINGASTASKASKVLGQSADVGDFVGNIGNQFDVLANDWVDFGGDFVSSMSGGADVGASLLGDVGGGVPWLSGIGDFLNGDIGGAAESVAGAMIGQALIPIPGVGAWIGSTLAEPVIDIAGDILGGIGDIFGGCFITTAVCNSLNKPDDCYELTILREFRDTWMTAKHPEMIEQYYAEAPAIVARINEMPEASKIFNEFNRNFIQPAIKHIEDGENEIAFRIYTNLFNYAKEIAGGTHG